jgi:hypothetical protein
LYGADAVPEKRWPSWHGPPGLNLTPLMLCHGPVLLDAHCSRRLLTGGRAAPEMFEVSARQPEKPSPQCWFSEAAKPVYPPAT